MIVGSGVMGGNSGSQPGGGEATFDPAGGGGIFCQGPQISEEGQNFEFCRKILKFSAAFGRQGGNSTTQGSPPGGEWFLDLQGGGVRPPCPPPTPTYATPTKKTLDLSILPMSRVVFSLSSLGSISLQLCSIPGEVQGGERESPTFLKHFFMGLDHHLFFAPFLGEEQMFPANFWVCAEANC